MADFISYVRENWLNVVTATGVIGSLWIGIKKSNRDAKDKADEKLERAGDRHVELWTRMSKEPGLKRILQTELDVRAEPISVEEEEFINLVMVHFLKTWRLAKNGGAVK